MSQSLLPKILKLADVDDIELQCCVVKILGELKIKNKKVATLFSEKITSENGVLRRYTLEALSKNPSIDSVDALFSLLEKNDSNRVQVESILSQLGSSVVAHIKKRMQGSNECVQRSYITVLANVYTAEARNFLLDHIFDSSIETLKHICFSLRDKFENLKVKDRQTVFTLLKTRLEKAEKQKKYSAMTSYIILISYVRVSSSKTLLVKYAKKAEREMFHVRRNALIALSKLGLKNKQDEVAKVLFSIAERGEINLIRIATDIVSAIEFSPIFDKQIESVFRSDHSDMKRFAIAAVGQKSTKKTIVKLIEFLDDRDMAIRAAAVERLQNMPESVSVLLPMLDTIVSESELTAVAHILKQHKQKLTLEKCKTLYDKLEKLFTKGNQKYRTYYTIFRIAYPEFLHKKVLKKVQLLKGRKKFKEAEAFAQLISRGLFFTDEVKYETAIVQLKNSNQDMAMLHRASDNSLRIIEQLIKSSDLALVKRLKKETVLDANDLFYLGFHFSEKLFELKDFGVEILKFCIKKYPRAKVSPKAKKKLQHVGIKTK